MNTPVTEPAAPAIQFIIPVCCREGHDDCPHVVKRQKKEKRNIGV